MGGVTYRRLTVKAVHQETADAHSFTLRPERGEEALFTYRPGQFLTFRIPHNGGEIRRSYSLSSAPQFDPDMKICVKRVADGRGSNWLIDNLIAGSRIEASVPAGRFLLRSGNAPLLLIAGGSGITPCISLIKHALADTDKRVKLVYANQSTDSIIYREALEFLAERYRDRFVCEHWLDDLSGLMTQSDIMVAIREWQEADHYICGPDSLMDMAEQTIGEELGPDSVILTERFVSPDDVDAASNVEASQLVSTPCPIQSFSLHLDGKAYDVPISGTQTLLQAAEAAGVDVPKSCTEGHCGTCMAHLREGQVTMASTRALSKRNIDRGLVLACQARPSSPEQIMLDFDI